MLGEGRTRHAHRRRAARHAHPATPARHAGAGRSHPGSSPQIWLPAPVRNRGITPPMGLT